MNDYIPQSDANFNVWQGNLYEIIQSNYTLWGISEEDIATMTKLKNTWDATYKVASNKQNRTRADVQAKDDAGVTYIKFLRGFVAQWLSNNSKVPNSERERMGLTIRNNSRTPIGIPISSPQGSVDFSSRLQHTLHIVDELTPNSKAKPAGVHGCEIWMKMGEAPKSASELTYLVTHTRSTYLQSFDGSDVGKTAHYWLCWVNSRGERGPWGRPFSAMVVG